MHVWSLKVGDLLTPTSVVPSVNLFLFACETYRTKVELLLIITDFSWLYLVTPIATAVNVIDMFISQMVLGLKVMFARVTNCHPSMLFQDSLPSYDIFKLFVRSNNIIVHKTFFREVPFPML